MSIRTLIEINHDFAGRDPGLLPALDSYVRSGSREHAEALERFGLKVLGQRHHSNDYLLNGTPDGFPPRYFELPRQAGPNKANGETQL